MIRLAYHGQTLYLQVLTFDDPLPLRGKGHNRLGFSGGEAATWFDNLRVYPYDSAPPPSATPTRADHHPGWSVPIIARR